jgi:chromosome segregation ATPase
MPKLQAMVESHTRQLEGLREVAQATTNVVNIHTDDLEAKRQAINSLSACINSLTDAQRGTTETLRETEARAVQNTARVCQLEAELTAYRTELAVQKKLVEGSVSQTQLSDTMAAVKREMSDQLNNTVASVKKEMSDQLNGKLVTLQEDMSAELKMLTQRVAQLEIDNNALKQNVKNLEAEKNELFKRYKELGQCIYKMTYVQEELVRNAVLTQKVATQEEENGRKLDALLTHFQVQLPPSSAVRPVIASDMLPNFPQVVKALAAYTAQTSSAPPSVDMVTVGETPQ